MDRLCKCTEDKHSSLFWATVSGEDKNVFMNIEIQKDDATLRCIVDSNPPATITWRKEGLKEVFSPDKEIVFSPVTRHSAGLYSCSAENALGMSKPAYVDLDVKCKLELILYFSLKGARRWTRNLFAFRIFFQTAYH